MKKSIKTITLFLFAAAIVSNAQAQDTGTEKVTNESLQGLKPNDANRAIIKNGYTLSNGWHIQPGDTLYVGKGTLPNKSFAFIYQSKTSFAAMGGNGNDRLNGQNSLKSSQANRLVVKRMQIVGSKKGGYMAIAVVGLGSIVNYWVEIDNAADAGEIKTPKEYQAPGATGQATAAAPAQTKAEKLKDLKKLLDDGTLTKEEFDTEKKKVLDEK